MVRIASSPVAEVVSNTVEPTIGFRLTVALDPFEGLLGVEGELTSADGNTHISVLRESPKPTGQAQDISASKHWDSGSQRNEKQLDISLVAPLSHRAVGYLESEREKNPRKDVLLSLRLNLKVLRSRTTVLPTNLGRHGSQSGVDALTVPKDTRGWSTGKVNQWVLSGEGSEVFLHLYTQGIGGGQTDVRIPAEDWRHDFAPALGIGRFVVAELPVPEAAALTGEVAERINTAIESLGKMREELQQGEWDEVVKAARPVAELLRNKIVWDWLQKKLGYPEDAIPEFQKAVSGTFDFAAKALHPTDRSGALRQPVAAAKEDAYLVYSLSVGLVNLLAQKMKKAA